MKLVTGLLAVVLLLAGVGASHAVVRIGEDRGGRIGTYVDKYQELRTSGQSVIIDGLCASACTIVLGAVPHDKICVTSHATLGFHAAWDFGANGRAITNPEATQMLYSMYPSAVRRWIAQHDNDFVVRVYAVLVTPEPHLPRTTSCSVVTADGLAGWPDALPRQRRLSADRQARPPGMLGPVPVQGRGGVPP